MAGSKGRRKRKPRGRDRFSWPPHQPVHELYLVEALRFVFSDPERFVTGRYCKRIGGRKGVPGQPFQWCLAGAAEHIDDTVPELAYGAVDSVMLRLYKNTGLNETQLNDGQGREAVLDALAVAAVQLQALVPVRYLMG